jgi:hypothetical protein
VRRRERRPDLPVAAGERLLAWTTTTDGTVVGGTRDAFYGPDRLPWEQVEAADWDRDSDTFRVSEVGSWGRPRPSYEMTLSEPARLLQLVRERVTASIVLQRHVAVRGGRGLRVVARRAPAGAGELTWLFEFDEGVDPEDPFVAHAAQEALLAAREEVGGR